MKILLVFPSSFLDSCDTVPSLETTLLLVLLKLPGMTLIYLAGVLNVAQKVFTYLYGNTFIIESVYMKGELVGLYLRSHEATAE